MLHAHKVLRSCRGAAALLHLLWLPPAASADVQLVLPRPPQVRKATDKITLPIILEIIDNMNFGPQYRKIPASEAKNR